MAKTKRPFSLANDRIPLHMNANMAFTASLSPCQHITFIQLTWFLVPSIRGAKMSQRWLIRQLDRQLDMDIWSDTAGHLTCFSPYFRVRLFPRVPPSSQLGPRNVRRKVDVPNSVVLIGHLFMSGMCRCGSKNGYQKDVCLKEIGLCFF